MNRKGTESSPRSVGEWRQGGALVAAAATGVALPSLMPYTMGVFIQPLHAEFGWSRTLITSGLMINATIGVLFAGLIGMLIDRFGPRRIALPGVIFFCSMFGLLSTASGSSAQWWLSWLFLALASTMVSPTIWTSAVVSRFDASRGLATSLALVGASLTGALGPIIGGYLVATFGWRGGYLGLASLWIAVALPLILLFFYSASDLERKVKVAPHLLNHEVHSGVGVGSALKEGAFYKISVSCALLILAIQMLIVHFIPIAQDRGLARDEAILIAGMVGFSAILGRLASGVLLDHFAGYRVGGYISLLPGLSVIAILPASTSFWISGLSALLLGLAAGAEMEIASNLASRYLPLKRYGTLFGLMVGAIGLAAGAGPFVAAKMYDTLGSYDAALWSALPISFISALLLFSLGPLPSGGAQHARETAS